MNKIVIIAYILVTSFPFILSSQNLTIQDEKDKQVITDTFPSVHYLNPDTSTVSKKKKDNYFNRLVNGNVDRTFEKKMDISFIAIPSYGREPGFGLGAGAIGLYRLDRKDSIMPPSDIVLTANVSLNGFFLFSADGNNNFKGNRSSLSYQISFFNKNLDFWGVNFNDCKVNPDIGYQRQTIKIYADYRYKMKRNFYIGGTLDFLYTKATKIDDESYLSGQARTYTATGLGFFIQYDSRDFIPNPKRGVHLLLRETIYPNNYGNTKRTLLRTTFNANVYQRVWEGAVLAFDIYGQASSNNLPWPLMPELGGPNRMRGYYRGRYIDNNILTGQVELRQHIYKRIGAVVWGGGGTVFPTIKEFDMKNILPNYGIGFRFEIKHNANLRVDFGVGKETGGFSFGFNEAF